MAETAQRLAERAQTLPEITWSLPPVEPAATTGEASTQPLRPLELTSHLPQNTRHRDSNLRSITDTHIASALAQWRWLILAMSEGTS